MLKALIIGAYGLIGAGCVRAFVGRGWQVRGLGRNAGAARRVAPQADWIIADATTMSPDDWRKAAEGVDVVVNAAGALQDGPGDDLNAIHVQMPTALVDALAALSKPPLIVQISAVGVSPDAGTQFYRTKAEGDDAVRASGLPYVVLRPGLVLGPAAYGGTALLRAAAALPLILPAVLPGTRLQSVFLEDLAEAVVDAAEGRIPAGTEADLVEDTAHTLPDLIAGLRDWLGLPPVKLRLPVPEFALRLTGHLADMAGRLGWRSPLRHTALKVLAEDVTGDPAPWRAVAGRPIRPMAETLTAMPATVQDRWFARLWTLLPIAIVTLSAFWLISGIVGLQQGAEARAVLTDRGVGPAFADLAVVGGGLLDIALGAAILWRPWARAACLGMAATAFAYLLGGTVLTPDLWADPLGPFTKILPAIALPLVTAAMLDTR